MGLYLWSWRLLTFFVFFSFFFFFNDTATTEIYTLSLHDALPICPLFLSCPFFVAAAPPLFILPISCCGSAPLFIQPGLVAAAPPRSEEHTSELQSPVPISYAVFCLKKKKTKKKRTYPIRNTNLLVVEYPLLHTLCWSSGHLT